MESTDLIEIQLKAIHAEKQITINSRAHHLVFGYIGNVQKQYKLTSVPSDIYNLLFIFYYKAVTFEYKSDYDENGILYWLGTNYGQTEWKNPAKRKLVALNSSGIGIGYIEDMICRGDPSNYRGLPLVGYTGENPWFTIDFGKHRKIRPTCYTLRHSQGWFGLMRGWNFEASNDGKTWTIIKKHRNDESFQYNCVTNTFYIEKCKRYYQYFRIYATHKQHHGHWEITASCLEMYGHFIQDVDDEHDLFSIVGINTDNSDECETDESLTL
eukprot:205912_1